jgi:hypothetical protein
MYGSRKTMPHPIWLGFPLICCRTFYQDESFLNSETFFVSTISGPHNFNSFWGYTKGSCLPDTSQQCLRKKIRIQEEIAAVLQEEIQKLMPNILSLANRRTASEGGYPTLVQEIGHLCVCIEFPKHSRVI